MQSRLLIVLALLVFVGWRAVLRLGWLDGGAVVAAILAITRWVALVPKLDR